MDSLLYLSFLTFEINMGRGKYFSKKNHSAGTTRNGSYSLAQASVGGCGLSCCLSPSCLTGLAAATQELLSVAPSRGFGPTSLVSWVFRKSQNSKFLCEISGFGYVGSNLYETVCKPNAVGGLRLQVCNPGPGACGLLGVSELWGTWQGIKQAADPGFSPF